jgi:hypothetical protein
MSDNILRFIPTQPAFVPDNQSQSGAQKLAHALFPQAGEIKTKVSGTVEFVDAGSNYHHVSCPKCGRKFDPDWWAASMDEAYKDHFESLEVIVPCCGVMANLNDLTYVWPQGFAKFVLEVLGPNVSEVEDNALTRLEQSLGCKLRVILVHY